MPKTKKKAPPITGAGRSPEKLSVQKSNPLYGLWRSELTLAEFKILDTYLSRINSHEPEKRSVRFEKGEIERLLGVTKINRPDLQERLKHLGTMVPIDDPTKTKAFRLISLFERADCDMDENGIWQVDLTCTPSALKYIFNVENIGYFRYKLKVVTALRSRYAYVLFLYLEKNRHMHLSWEIDVDELRDLLKADEPLYREFKYFNAQLLKPVQRELFEKTDCKFTYEPVKTGRTVKAVRFTLEPITEQYEPPELPEQLKIAEYPQLSDHSRDEGAPDQRLELLYEACKNEFSQAQMEELFAIIVTIPERKLPSVGVGGIELRRYHYLAEAYARMNCYQPKNRLNYLTKLLKADAEAD